MDTIHDTFTRGFSINRACQPLRLSSATAPYMTHSPEASHRDIHCPCLFVKKMIRTGKEEEGRRAPKGHFVVYVGEGHRRFVVPLAYLKNAAFERLMQSAADEFGYGCSGGIVLPCDEATFCRVTQSIHGFTGLSPSSPPNS